MTERSLILIKPDGVARSLMGRILQRFEDAGMKVIGMKMLQIDKEFAKKHYSAHVEKDFYPVLEEFIVSGPVVAMCIEGVEVIENVRKIVGSTEPKSSAPGTIRGDFAQVSYGYAERKGITMMNLIHASGNKEDAAKEVELWFTEDELMDYKKASEKYTF